jgi:hypothetical protein
MDDDMDAAEEDDATSAIPLQDLWGDSAKRQCTLG